MQDAMADFLNLLYDKYDNAEVYFDAIGKDATMQVTMREKMLG